MNIVNSQLDYTDLQIIQDKKMNFCAIICLHRYGRGPSLGGCRFVDYSSLDEAIFDAIKLSEGMSYKSAISNVPHDGGKAVIMRPSHLKDKKDLLKRFADSINAFGGKYITTIDSGTNQSDMAVLKEYTPFVTGFMETGIYTTEDSTALGVYKGIKAAVKLVYGHDDLSGLHVAIQGVGNVGYRLAKMLHQAQAHLTVSDIHAELVDRCAAEFNATIVEPSKIHSIECDILSPCALGSIVNDMTISTLNAKIIAGGANNQLSSPQLASKLEQAGIFYIPDFVINAGGLIHLSLRMRGASDDKIKAEVGLIYHRIIDLAEEAKLQKQTLADFSQMKAHGIIVSHR